MSEKIEVGKLVSLLNELVTKCHKLEGELEESSAFIIEQRKENKTLKEENEQLKKSEKINMGYAEQIVEENQKLRIAKNDLRIENEQLKKENNDYEKQFRIINEKLDEYIKTADTYRIPISSLKYGDDLGYFNGVYQYMKKLKKDIGGIGYE